MSSNRILVNIFRRGAAAMTNEIVPDLSVPNKSYFDDYRTPNRFPSSHAAHADVTALDGQDGYAVNNRFTAFRDRFKHPTFRSAAFLTLGTPAPTRSHFYEQNRIDGGGVSFSLANSGFWNRFAALFPIATPTPLDLMTVGNTVARSTIGLISLYATARSVTPLLSATAVTRAKTFMTAVAPLDIDEAEIARATSLAMLDTNIGLSNLVIPASIPSDASGAPKYPSDVWAQKMRDTARLIIAGIPSRVICCDYDGWDHHSDLGGSVSSPSGVKKHGTMLAVFNDTLEAFIYDMEQSGNASRLLLTTQTEFHRTMRQNGNDGADHGQSHHAYAWGGQVASDLYGRILDYRENNAETYADAGSWQSPFPNRLLKHTMDYRDYQRMQCEWLAGRVLTPTEITAMWGGSFTSNMTAAQRAAIAIS